MIKILQKILLTSLMLIVASVSNANDASGKQMTAESKRGQ